MVPHGVGKCPKDKRDGRRERHDGTACTKRKDPAENRKVLKILQNKLTFAELRCTTCAFESVLLSFLHSGVAG